MASARVIASMASTTGTARIATQGSWRDPVGSVKSDGVPSMVAEFCFCDT